MFEKLLLFYVIQNAPGIQAHYKAFKTNNLSTSKCFLTVILV